MEVLYAFNHDFVTGFQTICHQVILPVIQIRDLNLRILHGIVRLQDENKLFVLDFDSSGLRDNNNPIHRVWEYDVAGTAASQYIFIIRENSTHADRAG